MLEENDISLYVRNLRSFEVFSMHVLLIQPKLHMYLEERAYC